MGRRLRLILLGLALFGVGLANSATYSKQKLNSSTSSQVVFEPRGDVSGGGLGGGKQ